MDGGVAGSGPPLDVDSVTSSQGDLCPNCHKYAVVAQLDQLAQCASCGYQAGATNFRSWEEKMAQLQHEERKYIMDQINNLTQTIQAEKAQLRQDEANLVTTNDMKMSLHSEVSLEVQRDVMPLLEHARFLISQLNYTSLSKLQREEQPPKELQTLLEALCICRGLPPDSQTFARDPFAFVQILQQQSVDTILTPTVIGSLRAYASRPEASPARVAPYGVAAAVLASWVRTIVDCYESMSRHQPKCDRLAAFDAQAATLRTSVDRRQKNLAGMLAQLKVLENELDLIQYSSIGFG